MPVAIYARISSDRDGSGATDRQINLCHDLIARRDDLILYPNTSKDPALGGYREAFHDENISAYSGRHRPAWAAVEALVMDGKIDGIVAYNQDRIHRRAIEMMRFIGAVGDAGRGLKIYYVGGAESDFNSEQGRLLASIMSLFASHEVESTTRRIVDEKAEAAGEGLWNGGTPPLGYMAVKPKRPVLDDAGQPVLDDAGQPVEVEDHKARSILVPHPVVGPALRRAATSYIAGTSLSKVLANFRAETGLTTEYSSFKHSLSSPSIAGLRMHFPVKKRAGRSVHELYTTPRVLEKEASRYPAQWSAIISETEWMKLRDKLVNNNEVTRGKKPVKSLLAGMIFCGSCGAKLGNDGTTYKRDKDGNAVLTKNGKPAIKHYPTYRCDANNHGCGKMQIGAILLDAFITTEFKKVLGVLLRRQAFEPIRVNETKMIQLENDIALIGRELVEAYGRVDRGILDEETYKTVSDQKLRRKRELEVELSALRSESSSQEEMQTALQLFDKMDTSQRRQLMATLIRRIEIRKVPARAGRRNILDERRIVVRWDMGGVDRVTHGGIGTVEHDGKITTGPVLLQGEPPSYP